jgi:hypothetical protein
MLPDGDQVGIVADLGLFLVLDQSLGGRWSLIHARFATVDPGRRPPRSRHAPCGAADGPSCERSKPSSVPVPGSMSIPSRARPDCRIVRPDGPVIGAVRVRVVADIVAQERARSRARFHRRCMATPPSSAR